MIYTLGVYVYMLESLQIFNVFWVDYERIKARETYRIMVLVLVLNIVLLK